MSDTLTDAERALCTCDPYGQGLYSSDHQAGCPAKREKGVHTMAETTVVKSEPVNFERPANLTGDITIEAKDKTGFRVWLAQSLGSVQGGVYEGTSIVSTGRGIGLYVKREGKSVGTVLLDLSPIVQAAIAAFEEEESK